MVVSQNKGTQYRPQYTIVLIIGTPKKVPLILGNPHISRASLWRSERTGGDLRWKHLYGVLDARDLDRLELDTEADTKGPRTQIIGF